MPNAKRTEVGVANNGTAVLSFTTVEFQIKKLKIVRVRIHCFWPHHVRVSAVMNNFSVGVH